MRRLAFLLLFAGAAHAQEAEIQRALVQRDQMGAEFAAGVRGAPAALSDLHARQLGEILAVPVAPELRPYQRQRMADERALVLTPPVIRKSAPDPESRPLALPGGPRRGVDPVLPQGLPY